jgi:hypothetical protein
MISNHRPDIVVWCLEACVHAKHCSRAYTTAGRPKETEPATKHRRYKLEPETRCAGTDTSVAKTCTLLSHCTFPRSQPVQEKTATSAWRPAGATQLIPSRLLAQPNAARPSWAGTGHLSMTMLCQNRVGSSISCHCQQALKHLAALEASCHVCQLYFTIMWHSTNPTAPLKAATAHTVIAMYRHSWQSGRQHRPFFLARKPTAAKTANTCAAIKPALQKAAAHTVTAIYRHTSGDPTQSNPYHTRCSHK